MLSSFVLDLFIARCRRWDPLFYFSLFNRRGPLRSVFSTPLGRKKKSTESSSSSSSSAKLSSSLSSSLSVPAAAEPAVMSVSMDGLTKAERAFEEAQRKRVRFSTLTTFTRRVTHSACIVRVIYHSSAQEASMIEKKIAKSHRQKIEEFNTYLSKMPEHHDIPRVRLQLHGDSLSISYRFESCVESSSHVSWCQLLQVGPG
jgi:hypothetical protein